MSQIWLTEQQQPLDTNATDTEVDELENDSSPIDDARTGTFANMFKSLSGVDGDENKQNKKDAEGFEDEHSDSYSQGREDHTEEIIDIISSCDGSSFYIITDNNHTQPSSSKLNAKSDPTNIKSWPKFLTFSSSSPPPSKIAPSVEADNRTAPSQLSKKRKRDTDGYDPTEKKQRGAGTGDRTVASKPEKRRPGRPRKVPADIEPSEVEDLEGDEEDLEDSCEYNFSNQEHEAKHTSLPVSYCIFHIPIGDPSDKQDKISEPVQFELNTAYDPFLYRTAKAMNFPVNELPRLSYKFGLIGKSLELPVRNESEYQTMMQTIAQRAEEERDRVMDEKAQALRGKKKKSKGKGVAPIQKPVEVYLCRKMPTKDEQKVCEICYFIRAHSNILFLCRRNQEVGHQAGATLFRNHKNRPLPTTPSG